MTLLSGPGLLPPAGVNLRTGSQGQPGGGVAASMGWGAASRALCAPPTPFPVRAPRPSHLPGREVSLPRGSSSATSQNTSSSRPSLPPNSGPWATRHCDLCHDAPTGLETPRVISELLVLTQGLTLGAGMQGGSRRNEGNPGSHWPLLASCSFSPLLTPPQVWPSALAVPPSPLRPGPAKHHGVLTWAGRWGQNIVVLPLWDEDTWDEVHGDPFRSSA